MPLASGEAVAAAQVMVFDLIALQRGPVARATTDAEGYFALASLGGPALPQGVCAGAELPESVQSLYHLFRIKCQRPRRCGWRCSMFWGSGLRRW